MNTYYFDNCLNFIQFQTLSFKQLFKTFFLLLTINVVIGQTTGDYRTRANGNWNSTSVWQQYNGLTWVNISSYPPNSGTINNNVNMFITHRITLNLNLDVENVYIEVNAGGRLTINTGITFNLNNNSSILLNGTDVDPIRKQNNVTSRINFNEGSKYTISNNLTSFTITPVNIWHINSIIEFKNSNSNTVTFTNPNQNFGIILYDRPNQTSTQNYNFGNIQNRLEIISTGTGSLVPVNSNLNFNGDIIINGGTLVTKNSSNSVFSRSINNLTINSGTFRLHNATNGNTTFTVRGNFIFNGGTFSFCGQTTDASSYFDVEGNIELNSKNFVDICVGTDSGIYFTGSTTSNFISTVSLNSNINNRFYYQANALQGLNLIFNGLTESQSTFSGEGNQNPLGPYIPVEFNNSLVKNLTINNPLGVNINVPFQVNENIYLNIGNLNNITNNITLANNSTIHRTGGSISSDVNSSSSYNVNYPAHTAALTTGNEIPTATDRLANLTISNTNGIKANKSFTVNGVLALNASNPNTTDGLLDMVNTYGNYATVYSTNSTDQYNNLDSHVLTLGASASVTGNADITGKIRRSHTFNTGTPYTFGNQNTQLTFTSVSGSAMPSSITVVATKGDKGLHVDKDGDDSYRGNSNQPNVKATVKRLYQVLRTGGDAATRMTIRLAYDSSELNGNNSTNLVLWDHHLPYGGVSPHEHGQTNRTSNYVELTGHGLFYLAQENDAAFTKYWMISEKETTDIIWIGAVPGGSWDILSNWSDGKARTNTDKIVIPNNTTYSHELILSNDKQIGTIEVKENGKFTLKEGKTLTINGGPAVNGGAGSWNNQGTFIAENDSKVVFTYSGATLAGKGDFHHMEVANGADLLVSGEVDIKIKGNLTLNGAMDAQTNTNTITFNGASQNIPVPTSGVKTGYYNLKIEQTSGNASLSGNTRIGGTLTLNNGNLNVGTNTLSLHGNYFEGNLSLLNVNSTSSLELKNTDGGNKTLPSFTELNNLILDAPNSTFQLEQNANLFGNLSIANSKLELGSYLLNRNTAGGNLILGENAHLKIGGTNGLPQNYLTHNIHSSSTVEYAGTNQEISLPATSQKYGNLILSESGTKKLPDAVNQIEIQENLTIQNNANFELDTDKNLIIKKRFINNSGTALFKDKSSLVQIDNLTNIGNITYQRTTRNLKHLDFVYWGAMVNNQAIKNMWMSNASENFYLFNPNINNWQQVSGNTIMQPGVGYIARGRYISGGWPAYGSPTPPSNPTYTANFASTPNNGDITVNVVAEKFNLLGNPYPSVIDMVEFAKQGNASVELGPFEPTFYIWTQTTPITNNSYTGNDYAYYNAANNTSTAVSTFTPNRYLNAGQAFFIKTKVGATNATFKNEYRVINNNNNFTKPGNSKNDNNNTPIVMDRYWLNLKNSIQDFKQIAIVHMPNATNEYDTVLESPAFNGNANMNFFSLIGTTRVGIQSRASMVPQDEFPLGFQATTAGNYQIELANKEGVFTSHPIYLIDLLTNQSHNLQTGTYSFTTASGVHNNRFKIKYNNLTLSTNPFELQNIVAFISNETLHVKTGGEFIEKMEIYDIQGRLLQTIQGEASAQLEVALQMANQVILLKIKTTDGKTGTKKLIY
ncbi:MAG: hypothetical protein KGZ81_02975 [Flavobacteriales bacterium]|nr:hypothetical protein [Flavobacteriales bacterium]